jgi:hypothetical protein
MTGFDDLVELAESTLESGDASTPFEKFQRLGLEMSRRLRPGDVVALLRDYERRASLGRLECGSSHHHPNGFEKLSLYRSTRSELRIRLHLWRDGLASIESTIHDHRWHFASYVVAGKMEATNFARCERNLGDEYHCCRTSDISEAHQKHLEPDGMWRLAPTVSYVLGPGDSHAVQADVPHRVVAARDGASATLVVTGVPVRTFSHSFRCEPLEAPVRDYAIYPHTRMLERLGAALELLEGLP